MFNLDVPELPILQSRRLVIHIFINFILLKDVTIVVGYCHVIVILLCVGSHAYRCARFVFFVG